MSTSWSNSYVPTAADEDGDEVCLGCDSNLGPVASSRQHTPIDCVVVLAAAVRALEAER